MTARKRVAILISGRGTNMRALIEAAKTADYPAEIVGVISNKAGAPGLDAAKTEGLPTAIVAMKDYPGKAAADAAIDAQLREWKTDIVCLAGFMRLLSAEFCEKWQGKAINIHPSLLPDFPGLETHRRALDAEVPEHGCTVHFLTANMDDGPIIGQVAVPIEFGDTESQLAARVLKAEHKLYPWALAQIASGAIRFEDVRRNG
jgi:phosphoribosylglycinamide formyltransferase 1